MTPAEFSAIIGAARKLLAWSDARTAETAVRLTAERDAYAAGVAEGERLGRARALGELAEEKREISAAVAEALAAGDARAEAARWLWHVCCRECRRTGHHAGCARCQDRTRQTFAVPHPDDYLGAVRPLLTEARGAA